RHPGVRLRPPLSPHRRRLARPPAVRGDRGGGPGRDPQAPRRLKPHESQESLCDTPPRLRGETRPRSYPRGVDLSGLIFVVLAVGWAVYLIPRALRHHEEIAASRPVDNFSETVRVLERTPATMKALLTPPVATEATPAPRAKRTRRPSTPARRRRRVLGLLLLVTAATGVAAYLAYLPAWSPAIPGTLVVAWLVLCRLMVRKAAPVRRSVAPSAVVEEGLRS